MSERYGTCRACGGTGEFGEEECFICGGTGFSGDAMLYMQKNADKEFEEELLNKLFTVVKDEIH